MNNLQNKKILLGITGGIAAYKSAVLARLLIKQGVDLRVVMTPAAQEFIQPLTFQTLTGHQVYIDAFAKQDQTAMDHIELARWAELILIAPASANTIAKLNHGEADNLLLTICLASLSAIAIAPAMNEKMYHKDATQANLQQLLNRQFLIWGPAQGEQACGDEGYGRMLEASELQQHAELFFQPGVLQGKKVLITAGPTQESIDPVRYISNHSSGKMGYSLANAATQAGAKVTLISGPVSIPRPQTETFISVTSAQQMFDAVHEQIGSQDIFIATAAVADYRINNIAQHKIKKNDANMNLELVKNPDILQSVSALTNRPFCLGFAAETENLEQNGMNKLQLKNLDMIAVNQVGGELSAFNADSNAITLLTVTGKQQLARTSKTEIAKQLIELLADEYNENKTQ